MKRLISPILVALFLVLPLRLLAVLGDGYQDFSTFTGTGAPQFLNGFYTVTGTNAGDTTIYKDGPGLYTQTPGTGPFVIQVSADNINEASFYLDSFRIDDPFAGGPYTVVLTGTDVSNGTHIDNLGALSAGTHTITASKNNYHVRLKSYTLSVTNAWDIANFTLAGFTASASLPPPPAVTSVSPIAGPLGGGNSVTITGTNLSGATAVKFGSTNATGFTVNSNTQITATAPAGSAGTVDITVTTSEGTSTTNAGDQYVYVTAPTVTSILPTAGPTGGGTSVVITGSNLTGTTAVKFGSTNATGFTVNSNSQITATAPAGSAGTVDITATTAGGTSATSSADQFTYVAAPSITSISPTAGPTGGGTTVTLTGTNFSGATDVNFGATPATGFTVNSATSITATAPAGTGTVDVRVTTAGGTSATSSADQFTYVPAPAVTSISPTAGPTGGGTTVTLTGTNFTGATDVNFGATPATGFTVNSATSITATAPFGTGTVDVRVTTAGGTSATSSADQFTYVPAPAVTSISPTAGPTGGGTTVTLTGTTFTGATAVNFGATPATGFSVNSATSITATAPAGTGTVDVRVTTAGGTSATSSADQFTYVAAPTVTSISPTSGPTAGGTSVTLTGTHFTGATDVKFGATNATGFTVNSATSITATSPAGSAGTVDITVTTTGGTSATSSADQFTYVAAPTVTSISPTSGPTAGGTSVTLTGTHFTGATDVKFGATNATGFTVNSATSITATSPAGSASTVDITVTTVGGTSATSSADQFTYVAPPTVTAVTPNGGPLAGGTSVTLTGTNLTGATAVKFGLANAASFAVNSATSITATSPAGSAGTVNVTVTTVGGTSATGAGNQFSYLTTPSITSALTASGTYGQAFTTYTITATNSPTSFGATGLPAGLAVSTSTGAITGTPAAAGTFSVTISATNSGNTGTATLVLTIQKSVLTITANDATRAYGAANPAFSVRYTGLKNGDTDASLTVQPSLDCAAILASDAGSYPIVPSAAVTPNYEIYYVAGSLTVTKLPQTITFTQPADALSTDNPFNLYALSSSGLPVTFSVVSGPALLTGNLLSLSGAPGTVTVRASQAGDKNHEAATPVDRSFKVTAVQQLVYMGTIQSGSATQPVAALYNAQTRKGTLIGRLPGLNESFALPFTVAINGTWSAAQLTTPTAPALVGVLRSFNGLLSGTTLSGSIDGTGMSFSLAQDPVTGPSAAYAGYYHASRLLSSQGTLDTVVGTQGEVCMVLNTQGILADFSLTIDAAGFLHLEVPYTVSGDGNTRSILATPVTVNLHGSIDPQSTSIHALVDIVGYPQQSYAGQSSTTLRTDRLSNLSTLGQVSTSNNVTLITGFVISGPVAKPVLLRAVGPSLANFGVTNALAAPRLRVVQNGTLLKEVTGWNPELAAEFTRLGAFALKAGSTDAAVELTLDPGVYTMQVLDGDASGSALAEIYDASLNPQADYQRLVNISSRGSITSTAQQLTGGFVFGGNSPKKILVRAVGPGLIPYGVSGTLTDPVLKLYNSSSSVIASNDNWENATAIDASQVAASAAEISAAASATGAFPLVSGSKDAALLITLPPGVYTATVNSASSSATGVTLIEIYEVP